MAIGKKTEMLATGGVDAVVNLWHDSTAAEKEEAFRKEVRCLIIIICINWDGLLGTVFVVMIEITL